MGHVAKADGRVSELEIAAARAIMDHLRLNADQRRIAIECFTAGKQPDFPIDTSLDTLKSILLSTRSSRPSPTNPSCCNNSSKFS